MAKAENMFQKRLERHHDELRWLYMELYQNDDMFGELCSQMYEYYTQRSKQLKTIDDNREKEPKKKKKNDILGMMMYAQTADMRYRISVKYSLRLVRWRIWRALLKPAIKKE